MGVVVDGLRDDYGDFSDVMGSGSWGTTGMNASDFSALSKHLTGWIPNSRVMNFDPKGAGVLAGARQSASFLMAAMDRDNAIGNRAGALALLPANAALVARMAVPVRSYLPNLGSTNFLYIFHRGQELDTSGFGSIYGQKKVGIKTPGIFLAEASFQTNLGRTGIPATWGLCTPPVLHCYRDPKCTSQWQIAPNDALIYDPAQLRVLVRVGAPVRIIAGSAASVNQDSALNVQIAFLDENATITDPSVPPRPYVPMATVTATSAFSYSLSHSSPVSVYKVLSSTATYVSAQICCVNACNLSAMGVSAFLGGFPAAHVYYGANVGVTGDVNWPGDFTGNISTGELGRWSGVAMTVFPLTRPLPPCFTAAIVLGSTCGAIVFRAAPNVNVWVVAGSPGAARGTSLSATIAFTFGAAATTPWSFKTVTILQFWGWDGTAYVNTGTSYFLGLVWTLMTTTPCSSCSGKPMYRSDSNIRYYLLWSATNSRWQVFTLQDTTSPTFGYISGTVATISSNLGLISGACPGGTFNSAGTCTACPYKSQIANPGALAATDCYCPYGWGLDSTAFPTACTGPSLGVPGLPPTPSPTPSQTPSFGVRVLLFRTRGGAEHLLAPLLHPDAEPEAQDAFSVWV